MGGMLPTHLAAAAPDRVVAGICIGPVHPTPQVADVFKQRVPVVQEGEQEFQFGLNKELHAFKSLADKHFPYRWN
jgi:hypothetical protein